jgi:hypothetical protein
MGPGANYATSLTLRHVNVKFHFIKKPQVANLSCQRDACNVVSLRESFILLTAERTCMELPRQLMQT